MKQRSTSKEVCNVNQNIQAFNYGQIYFNKCRKYVYGFIDITLILLRLTRLCLSIPNFFLTKYFLYVISSRSCLDILKCYRKWPLFIGVSEKLSRYHKIEVQWPTLFFSLKYMFRDTSLSMVLQGNRDQNMFMTTIVLLARHQLNILFI